MLNKYMRGTFVIGCLFSIIIIVFIRENGHFLAFNVQSRHLHACQHIEKFHTCNYLLDDSEVLAGKNISLKCEGKAPNYRFGFVKTHKCASDTLAANFMRLAEENGLEIPLPEGEWNLNWPKSPGGFYRSRKKSGRFDMTTLHMMYDPDVWNRLLEPDYKLISIVRQPYKQFQSYFNYFGLYKKINREFQVPYNETLKYLLVNHKSMPKSILPKNPMLTDFGFQSEKHDMKFFIYYLEKTFSLIMIADYLDESLLLLRRELCLPMRDILVKTQNVAQKYKWASTSKATNELNEEFLERKYEHHSSGDYELFYRSNQTFWKKISRIPSFEQELHVFRNITKQAATFCGSDAENWKKTLIFEPTEWNEKIAIDAVFCQRFNLNVLQYIKRLKTQRYNLQLKQTMDATKKR